MKQITEREAGVEPAREDPLGDAPMFEEAAGLLGDQGSVRSLQLTFDDLEGLSAPERMAKHRKAAFLRAFALRGIIGDGCQAAGVSRKLVASHWLKNDAWFKELYEAATDEAADSVERELHRRAVEGIDVPVLYQGQPTTVVGEDGRTRLLTFKEYSDPLLSLYVKGVRREKFGDRMDSKVDLTARVGVLVVPGLADPATWEAAARDEQARYAGNVGDAPAIEHDGGKKG